MFRILVAEDDPHTRRYLCDVLSSAGYEPVQAKDGDEALKRLDQTQVDLIMLDVMMPKKNGHEVTRELRADGNMIPILMVTACETPEDRRSGFISGTDDYMVKPIDEQEMILRIAALLRRSRIASERRLEIGMLVLDYDTFTVTHPRIQTELPKKEFLLLFKLLSFPGKIFTKRQLMDDIWNYDSESDEHTIEVHIGRLRERFREVPEFEIVTVRGLGYKAVRKDGESAR